MGLQLLKPQIVREPVRPAAAIECPLLYQPYFSDAQRGELSPACAHLDASFNTGTTAREFLYGKHTAEGFDANRFWGLVSSKFDHKSPISVVAFAARAEEAQNAGYDGYVLNPMIGHAAIHINVWEQGVASGHQGIAEIQQHLIGRGYPLGMMQGSDTFAFCNYMCGNARFWANYFHVMTSILDVLDAEAARGSPVGMIYRGAAGYSRDATATMRPFIVERLLGCYLTLAAASGALNIAVHRPTSEDFDIKFGSRLGSYLHALNALKDRAVSLGSEPLALEWIAQRSAVAANPGIVWHLDDPPAWLPARR